MTTKEQKKYYAAAKKLREALDEYAASTGDRIIVKIRPQRGVDHARADMDFNSPELLKLKSPEPS